MFKEIQMKIIYPLLCIPLLLLSGNTSATSLDKLDIAKGKQFWQKKTAGKQPYLQRSCTTCHGMDQTKKGKHIRTNKIINPMALSITPTRFSDEKKVAKWFLRNCKWTIGRTCTVNEKKQILAYLKSL